MRVFIAIELEEEVKKKVEKIQKKLKSYAQKGKFTDPGNFHLTLRFIGEVGEAEIKSIKNAIEKTATKEGFFELVMDQVGSFPKKNKEIVWVGVKGELDRLQNLYKDLEDALEGEGFLKEGRQYNPHITLGREIVLNRPLPSIQEEIKVMESILSVQKISLMESVRINGKLVYRPIYVKSLRV
ncbi:2'-5' RNA ligase [Alkaliphilus metalliredigens QYMF]|uniref:RNA 2',3'-cyclic phosphodiesterase n=1 Tax=Alkaliphilus metalliredigens (strain QYMF) TaxID=293826 RepID=A6TLD2_ALKMQ|nr:RNA 2',3'-cyclic phosphodiesterase [Alkaliphilus metalliredigens]ABR47000.1 2'-5' RNA ligase [Alkaliphilus metalliredigens QYMF]